MIIQPITNSLSNEKAESRVFSTIDTAKLPLQGLRGNRSFWGIWCFLSLNVIILGKIR